jgi:16S rRNA processing protein RimM
MTHYLRLGKIVAAHGLKGELVLKHFLGKKSALKGLETVFIEEKKKSYLPWFIQTARIKNDSEVYLKMEGIDVREAALKLVQKEVWVPEAEYKKLASASSPVNLLGYRIIQNKNPVGIILEVIEQPGQLLCRTEIQNKEALIPLNEETLKKIDHRKKEVQVQLPEGLLEIYL